MLNWALLKHPMNWVTIILMVLIGMSAFHLVAENVGAFGATKPTA